VGLNLRVPDPRGFRGSEIFSFYPHDVPAVLSTRSTLPKQRVGQRVITLARQNGRSKDFRCRAVSTTPPDDKVGPVCTAHSAALETLRVRPSKAEPCLPARNTDSSDAPSNAPSASLRGPISRGGREESGNCCAGRPAHHEDDLAPQVQGQLGSLREQEYRLKKQGLDNLINQRLIGAEAKRRGITPDQLFSSRRSTPKCRSRPTRNSGPCMRFRGSS